MGKHEGRNDVKEFSAGKFALVAAILATRRTLLMVVFVLLVTPAIDVAEAKFLKHGVRAGDRSSMTIVRRPGKGVRTRIRAPGAVIRQASSRSATAQQLQKTRHAWFWKVHAAKASAASPNRFGSALDTMAKRRAGGQKLVTVATLLQIAREHGDAIALAARRHRLSEALLVAVIAVESRGKVRARSHAGAEGLMQLIPATARRFGVLDSFDPGQNIDGGAAYLNWLLKEFHGDPLLALAGYNAGEGSVRKHKGVPPYAETRDYVVKVFDALAAAQQLCGRPLRDPRQPCVALPGTI